MSKAYTVPTPFGLRIDTQKDVKTWPKCPPGLDKSSSFWRSFKSAPKHAMLLWSADFSVVYCLAFWLLAILSLQSQLVSDYALCDTQDKYIFHKQIFNNIFSQAHFLQHFTREIFHKFCPLLQDSLVSPAILTYCITKPTFSYFCLKFPVHLPKI